MIRNISGHFRMQTKGQWYYSVIDVVGALTDSVSPSAYWRKLKQRLKQEGNETMTNCHRLKLPALDEKLRLTDVANTEPLLRIIQSIPSPKAGADHLMYLADAQKMREELEKECRRATTYESKIKRLGKSSTGRRRRN